MAEVEWNMTRFEMREEVKGMLGTLVCWGGASPERLDQFQVRTATADAAFGPGATEYMHGIYLRGRLLSDAEALMRKALRPRVAPQPVRAEIAEIQRIQMNWFTNQIMGKEKPLYQERLRI
jgi:hypothetical protein